MYRSLAMVKMKSGARFFLLALFILFGNTPVATSQTLPVLRLPAVFGNDMVLQRDQPITIWGWATPGSEIGVSMAGQSAETVAAEDSTWSVTLPSLEAGGPFAVHVEGPETITLTNVLVGDVWLASGQSNMEWPLSLTDGASAVVASARNPQLRRFNVERNTAAVPLQDVKTSGWHELTPQTASDFSAVAFYFGSELHREVGVPIGLVESNWGGTVAEAWTSAEALIELPDFSAIAESLSSGHLSLDDLRELHTRASMRLLSNWSEESRRVDPGYSGMRPVWSDVRYRTEGWDTMLVPTAWEEAGVPDYDGIVWFRKSFEIPPGWEGDSLLLSLATIDDMDDTWVNGHRVGSGIEYGPRRYILSPENLRPGENVVAIRVVDRGGPGGIRGEPDELYVENAGERTGRISLAGAWLYRPAVDFATFPGPPWFGGVENSPTVLFNAMIAPLTPFAIKGVIWYQGESNAGRAFQYRTLFPALINDWRKQFDDEDMPFLFVQLANYMAPQVDPGEESAWAELREAQSLTLAVPNTEMAVTIDIGDADDIHPRNKADVGKRLALAALSTVYGQTRHYSGPRFVGMRRDGRTIRLLFSHIGSGLVARGGRLTGFAISGPDGNFVWADARIEDNMVIVSSPGVSDPRAVRYGWANNPPISLFNREGLPAAPFRTDDMPGLTQNAR